MAAAADVQRPGRVGGDELDQDRARARRSGRGPRSLAGSARRAIARAVPGVGEEEVDEARAGDLDPLDAVADAELALELGAEPGGDVARAFAERRRRAASPRWSCSRPARAWAGGRARARGRSARRRAGRARPGSTAARSSAIESVACHRAHRMDPRRARSTLAAVRVAVISDIHANLPALEAVLAAIDERGGRGDLVPRRRGRLRRRARRVRRPGRASAATSAWSATTTSRCSARSTSPPSRRPPRRRSCWTRETSHERTLELPRRAGARRRSARVGLYHASPRDPVWEYVLSADQADACIDAQAGARRR